MTDAEILESIERKGRLIRVIASAQGQLMNEAISRGVPKEVVLEAQRSARITEHRRVRNRRR